MEDNSAGIFAGLFGTLLYLVVLGLVIAGLWKMFVKAGKPGWAAIIPIYNIIVMLEITGKPIWHLVLCIIPFVNIFYLIYLNISLAKSFGQEGIGVVLMAIFAPFVLFPYLGFVETVRYVGPNGAPGAAGSLV